MNSKDIKIISGIAMILPFALKSPDVNLIESLVVITLAGIGLIAVIRGFASYDS